MTELPIVCTLDDDQLDRRRKETLLKFHALVQEARPIEEGYALKFSSDDAVLNELMHVIQLEKKCCKFLRFRLTVEPNGGPVWLELTGPEGTRSFLEIEFGL